MLMKNRLLASVALLALTACGTQDDASKHKADAKKAESVHSEKTHEKSHVKVDTGDVDVNKVSEALGHFIGRNLNTTGIKFDLENLVKGLREGAAGKPAPMSDADYEKAMTELQQKAFNATAEEKLAAANKFMQENVKEKNIVEVTPGILQYTILTEGNGPVVPEHGSPLINYVGKYQDGTVFGSSENAGGPIAVPIDQTIPGFSKGIAGMKEGEKRRLFVHPEAGYGTNGQLPPNSLLIFDIEVVKATAPEKESAMSDHGLSSDDEGDFDDDFDSLEADDEQPSQPEISPPASPPMPHGHGR